jgi:hypothetical protein
MLGVWAFVSASALVLRPGTLMLQSPRARSLRIVADANFAEDGADKTPVDWDEEAKNLEALARPMNPFYKAISDMEAKKLIGEFVQVAPEEVQFAVKQTVASLLGNMPPEIANERSITTTGKSLGQLMFNMQMTGYMFRNAEYRQSLAQSLDSSLSAADRPVALPPVKGEIKVKIAEGMEAKVDAQAYMAELRAEVEGLRAELAAAKQAQNPKKSETALIQYIQGLDKADQQQLTSEVGPEILEAMSQLVATIMIDLNIERGGELAAPVDRLRDLLVWQLVSGYKLRELEARSGLKDRFWGIDGVGKE